MAAAAVSSLACPLRRSSRLTSRRSHTDDDENELTPRALRALKRQRLTLDLVPLRRPKRRRKENLPIHPKVRLLSLSFALAERTFQDTDNRPILKPDPPDASPSPPEPLTPLTPLSPSPSPPGHDRPSVPSPPPDPLSPPTPPQPTPQPDHFSPPPLDPTLDTLIPFDALHPHFHPDLSVQIPPPCPPPQQQPLQPLELQDQFHSFPQPQLYVPPPVFVRDREINIWKLACQERVDCLLRRYGIDYIKALVQSEAHSISQDTRSPSPSPQTKFRLYTPASYTYSSTSWGSTSAARKPFPLDDDDPDAGWPIDDADWVDADVDMEDDDEDDYDDDDDTPDPESVREGQSTIEAVQSLVITDSTAPQVHSTPKPDPMHVDDSRKTAASPDTPSLSRLADTTPRPQTPAPHVYMPPPPLTPPSLPPLSSLHVPLLSEPPRAFMGRGTPPDRRRLIEWSGTGRFATNGMGPPLYLSPVPQRHPSPDVGIVPMSVDQPLHPPSHPSHSSGEWTSFLFSVLEGDGVGVGVGTNVAHPSHPSGPTWYELGLGSVPTNGLDLSLAHSSSRTPAIEPPVEESNTSSSTLRFALG